MSSSSTGGLAGSAPNMRSLIELFSSVNELQPETPKASNISAGSVRRRRMDVVAGAYVINCISAQRVQFLLGQVKQFAFRIQAEQGFAIGGLGFFFLFLGQVNIP